MSDQERAYEQIEEDDLKRLRHVALEKFEEVFGYAPVAGLYKGRLAFLALCQGAAQHFVDRTNGVKDFDVWAFFRSGPSKPFPGSSLFQMGE